MQSLELMPQAAPPAAFVPQSYLQPGLTLAQLLAIARAYWRYSAAIAATIVGLTAIGTAIAPKTYTASVTLMVNYEVNDPLGGREFPIGLLASYMSTQVDLLSSPDVLLPVIDRLKLLERKEYASRAEGDLEARRNWLAREIAKDLEVHQGQFGSQLIYVTVEARSPEDAANIANAIAEVYTEQTYWRLKEPASEHARRYTEELDELKSKVSRAQEQVTQFRQANNLVDVDAKDDIDVAMLHALENRLLEARNARRAAEAALAGDTSVSAGVMDSMLIQTLKTQLTTQQARLAELRATLGPRHPEVLQATSQIREAQAALAAETRRYARGAGSGLASARELEAKLAAAVEEQRAKLLRVRRLQDDGAKYVLELESAQSAYKRALDGYDQVMIASSGQYRNITTISRATPPLEASRPKVLLNILLSVMFGAILGALGPLVYELLSRRIRCHDDLERDHGVPVLIELERIAPWGSVA